MPHRILRRSQSSVVGVSGRGRLTEWIASANITAFTSLAANTFVFDQSLTVAEQAKRPFTITRTVGAIYVASDQTAAREVPFGAVGMDVVSAKATTTGPTALPDPITQEASDEWFMYQSFAALGTASVAENPIMVFPFDSRAQRKVQDGEDIAVMVSNASAAFGLIYILKFRILVKLS